MFCVASCVVNKFKLYINFNMASCCLFCTEIKQASAMKVYFQIAECRQSSAKIHHFFVNRKRLRAFFYEKHIKVSFFLVILHSEK